MEEGEGGAAILGQCAGALAAHTVTGPRATHLRRKYRTCGVPGQPNPPCAHQANPAPQVRRQHRGGPFPLLTCVLPIPPFVSPPGPSVVTSPRAPRQFLECPGMFSRGRPGPSWPSCPFFQNRPARTPLPPPPCRPVPFPSTGKSHPRRSIFLLRAPPSLPTRHLPLRLPSSHPSQSQLSSSSAQLASTTHTLAHPRSCISSMFLLWAARHGRTGTVYS